MAKNSEDTKSKQLNKEHIVMTFVASVLVALPLGYALGSSSETDEVKQQETHAHAEDTAADSKSHTHGHEKFEITDIEAAPTIDNLQVTMDSKSGWNVSFETTNFEFAPEKASGDHAEGEGHAHIYVDGNKLTRLYSNNYYLGELSEGSHTIKVTLNTNDHMDYALNGKVLEASVTIEDMHHSSDDSKNAESHDMDSHEDGHSHGDSDSHSH